MVKTAHFQPYKKSASSKRRYILNKVSDFDDAMDDMEKDIKSNFPLKITERKKVKETSNGCAEVGLGSRVSKLRNQYHNTDMVLRVEKKMKDLKTRILRETKMMQKEDAMMRTTNLFHAFNHGLPLWELNDMSGEFKVVDYSSLNRILYWQEVERSHFTLGTCLIPQLGCRESFSALKYNQNWFGSKYQIILDDKRYLMESITVSVPIFSYECMKEKRNKREFVYTCGTYVDFGLRSVVQPCFMERVRKLILTEEDMEYVVANKPLGRLWAKLNSLAKGTKEKSVLNTVFKYLHFSNLMRYIADYCYPADIHQKRLMIASH